MIGSEVKELGSGIESLDLIGKLQILLLFPKNSKSYEFVFNYFLNMNVAKETKGSPKKLTDLKNDLSMLLNQNILTLPLTGEQLSQLPNLFDGQTSTFLFTYVKIRQLFPVTVSYFRSLMEEKKPALQPSIVLNVISMLLHYDDIENKRQIMPAVRTFLGQLKAEPVDIPLDLIPVLKKLRKFLHHRDRELRLEARSITEAFKIRLELPDMLSLSIDGIKRSSEKVDDLVLVIGDTRSGKSTLINYLGGIEHELVRDQSTRKNYLTPKLEPEQKLFAKVGHSSVSETLYPLIAQTKVTFEYVLKKNVEVADGEMKTATNIQKITESFGYVDTPGFGDTRDDEEATCAALGVPLAIDHAKKIRAIVVTFPWSVSEPAGVVNAYRHLCHTLGSILNDPESLLKTISPTPIIFAITKPPRPERDECFDAAVLRNQFVDRIAEIIQGKKEIYAGLNNKKTQLIELEEEARIFKLCLADLSNLENGSDKNYFFLVSKMFKASPSKKMLIEDCIEKLKAVQSAAVDKKNTLIKEYRANWKDKIKEFEKLSIWVEETQAEKMMLNFITQQSYNIFIIRGYRDGEEDTPDHRDELLSYLKCLRENETCVPHAFFKFDVDSKEYKKVKTWANHFASEMHSILHNLLTFTHKIAKNEIAIKKIKEEINHKKMRLREILSTQDDEGMIAQIVKSNKEDEDAIKTINETIVNLKKEKEKIQKTIHDEIDSSPEIAYETRLKVEKRNWLVGSWTQTFWTYEFPGKQLKPRIKNQFRNWLSGMLGNDSDEYDIIPIKRVELSCTVDNKSKLVIGPVVPNQFFTSSDHLSKHSLERENKSSPIGEIAPPDSSFRKMGYFEQNEEHDFEKGKYSVNYYSGVGQDGYACVRVFVLPKYIPSYCFEKKKLHNDIAQIEQEINDHEQELKNIKENIKTNKKNLELIKQGLYVKESKISTIQNLIREIGFTEMDFVNEYFDGVKPPSVSSYEFENSESSLSQKLKNQETERPKDQKDFNSFKKSFYESYYLRMHTLNQVIILLKLENDYDVQKYFVVLDELKIKKIITVFDDIDPAYLEQKKVLSEITTTALLFQTLGNLSPTSQSKTLVEESNRPTSAIPDVKPVPDTPSPDNTEVPTQTVAMHVSSSHLRSFGR